MDVLLSEVIVPLVVGALGGAATHWWWLRRHLEEIRRAYDEELRKSRMTTYQKLWKEFSPLAVYAPEGDVTYQDIVQLGTALRRWYFEDGGLLFTTRARDVYFMVQEAIDRVAETKTAGTLRSRRKRWRGEDIEAERERLGIDQLPGPSSKDDERSSWRTGLGERLRTWPYGAAPDDDFVVLQFLASSLRTVLVEDLHARAPSILDRAGAWPRWRSRTPKVSAEPPQDVSPTRR